jgi:hypothetical protein
MRQIAAATFIGLVLLGGCAGGDSPDAASPRTTGYQASARIDSSCGILQPYFALGSKGLSRDDLEVALKTEFAKWDKDNSGDLSMSELDPLNDSLHAESTVISSVIDWDGSGRVSFQEFASQWRTMFQLCDSNSDKVLSLRELGWSPNVAGARARDARKPPEGASAPPKAGY